MIRLVYNVSSGSGFANPGMRNLGRVAFYLACLALWLILAAFGVELWARARPASAFDTPASIPFEMTAARRLFEPLYARYCPDWPFPLPEVPELTALAGADAQERERIAQERGEWILLVDHDETVVGTYGAALHGLSLDNGLSSLLAVPLTQKSRALSLRNALQQVFSGATLPLVTLPVHENDTAGAVKVALHPLVEHGETRGVFLAFSDSLYLPGVKRFKPNVVLKTFTTTVMMEQFSTNSHGFRGPEITVPKPPGRIRIACIGGSTTVWGFRDALTYPAMLQWMLRECYPGYADRIEVVNCGIYGLNSTEEPALIEEVAALEPDLLVHYNFINDLTAHLNGWLHSDAAWRSSLERGKRLLRHSRLLDRYANEYLLPSDERLAEFLHRRSLGNMEASMNTATACGMEAFFCSFAGIAPEAVSEHNRAYVEQALTRTIFPDLSLEAYTRIRELYNALLQDLCATKGAGYIPVAEEVRGECDLFLDECHFNPCGTEAQAQAVFRHIKDQVLVLLQQG